MNRTSSVIGLMVVFGLVAFMAIGYGNAASAGPVAVCAPVQVAPPPVCQAVQPAPTVCEQTAHVSLHNYVADVAHHLHAFLAEHHKVHYVTVAQAAPAVCQPVKVLPPAPPVCQPVKVLAPPPTVCQPALPAPAACEPARQVSSLHHIFHHHVVFAYATEQPAVTPTVAPPTPTLDRSTPKPPAPPTTKGA